ncbi:hypothetical protein ACF0H5_017688 [Mactra antiquata]
MNVMDGLPGFEGLLRDHKRLASKLTSDELRAIRNYIEERLRQEQADINFRLYALQNDYDVTVRKSSETISDLYQELAEKKDIIKHYQTSDEAISVVHKQKEERWDRKQELLLSEIEKLDGESNNTKTKLRETENKLEEKTNDFKKLEEKLEVANKKAETVEEAKKVLNERDETEKEMYRLKMDLDKRDKLIHNNEKTIASLKVQIEEFSREKEFNEMKVNSMQTELRKHMSEISKKCKDLSELQFQLQMEKRQTENLQKELRQATEDVQNYKRMLESTRPPVDSKAPIAITVRKDLDIMDIRIRSLDISVRLRMDEIKRIEDRLEDTKNEERLTKQIKSEIFHQGDTFLELTVTELIKHLDFKNKRLVDELKYARDWDHPRRDADVLRAEISALMKQAAICKITELSERAARQLQKIDLIMRGVSDTTKIPRIYKVSERSSSDRREYKTPRPSTKPTFVAASTPINGFDASARNITPRMRKRFSMAKNTTRGNRSFGQSFHDNHTDDSKLQYIDTVELDLSQVTPSHTQPRGSQSDRMTIKSISTTGIPAINE